MGEKKVVAVIVEGPSDEIAIGGIMKEYFASDEVQFAVVHGDITSDYTTSVNNVVSKVGGLVRAIQSRYGYRQSDFFKVIHIADTDGVRLRIKTMEGKSVLGNSVLIQSYRI